MLSSLHCTTIDKQGRKITILEPAQAVFVTEALKATSAKLAQFESVLGSDAQQVVTRVRQELDDEAKSYSTQS
jgi:hypothetical protein